MNAKLCDTHRAEVATSVFATTNPLPSPTHPSILSMDPVEQSLISGAEMRNELGASMYRD